MSLHNYIAKVWQKIGDFFKKLGGGAKKALDVGHEVVERIKNFVDSEGIDVLTEIIPGTLDDNIKDGVRAFLSRLLLIIDSLSGEQQQEVIADDQRLKAVIKKINALPDDVKKIFTHGIASHITEQVSAHVGDPVSWSDIQGLQEFVYKEKAEQAAKV
jgi:DNA-binding FrmR family transcriptional regulator